MAEDAHTTPGAADAGGATAHSPLEGLAGPTEGPVVFHERPFLGKLTLRGDAADPAFANAAAEALGVGLPTTPLTVAETEAVRVHWQAYDSWIIWTAPGAETALKAALDGALADIHHAVVDVSDYYTVIRAAGPRARDLLAKGCPLDLHPRAFGPGMCAGSMFQHATIFLTQIAADADDGPVYDIQVRWSMARYLWDYFVDGAREWRAAG